MDREEVLLAILKDIGIEVEYQMESWTPVKDKHGNWNDELIVKVTSNFD